MSASEFRSYSDQFPPINRTPTGLGVVDIRIVDDQMAHRYDPNSATLAAHKGPKGFPLGAPITQSDISGEPGYVVKFDQVQLGLTASEMVRLFMHSLRPEEFFALARKYGVFYEISSKFYDEDTGVADDPRLTFEEQDVRLALAGAPHLLLVPGDPPSFHSIVTLDQADRLIPLFSETFTLRAVALRLHEPEPGPAGRVAVDPFGNIVTLFTYADGSLRAYGPFESVKRAESYVPADAATHAIQSQHTTSSVVASCGSAR